MRTVRILLVLLAATLVGVLGVWIYPRTYEVKVIRHGDFPMMGTRTVMKRLTPTILYTEGLFLWDKDAFFQYKEGACLTVTIYPLQRSYEIEPRDCKGGKPRAD